MSHNGYANYETWCVSLWIWNTGLQEYFAEREKYGALALELQEWFTRELPELPGVFTDLLTSSLDKVDWEEIAATFTN